MSEMCLKVVKVVLKPEKIVVIGTEILWNASVFCKHFDLNFIT